MVNKCSYDPKELVGEPIGMFHCPLCGEMVVAGMEHPKDCDVIRLKDFFGRDVVVFTENGVIVDGPKDSIGRDVAEYDAYLNLK